MKDINFALVEDTRPPLYTALKYWGKKPHNIWRTYIENYTPEGGMYLDPFAGSAMSAFEAVKVGRKAIAFDINPLTAFTIEALASEFDQKAFEAGVSSVISGVETSDVYKEYFFTTCRKCNDPNVLVQHYKWDNGKLYELGILCKVCDEKYLATPTAADHEIAERSKQLEISEWYPDVSFHDSPSFTPSFVRGIGGANFSHLWTRRNLAVLAKLFAAILNIPDATVRTQLLMGFIKTLHLCTKMCVPRRTGADRAFSTSWGRSAYICAARQMEMNPLPVFFGSCIGKQSVESSLKSVKTYLGKTPKILYVDQSNKRNRSSSYDIRYGIVDINTITDFVDPGSVDFIMTDPPYGGLVQYLDLSALWLAWLQKYDSRFTPNFNNEITVKNGIQSLASYQKRFENGLKNLHALLKPEGKVVFTFHNKKILIWNAFLKAVTFSGFTIEKVIHQQNRRTGESNVSNPYGTSASDFYIRCRKSEIADLKTDKGEFEHFVLQKAIQLISLRNEPTPYQILFNGLLAEISTAGFDLQDFDHTLEEILSKHIGTIFTLTDKGEVAGKLWWFVNPAAHILYPDKLLSERVEETIVSFLRRKVSVAFDQVLGEIFTKYPNGLTPDIRSITPILKRYATQSSGKWVYKGEEVERDFTKHTEILYYLSTIGKKLGYHVFIGKREQPEPYNGGTLSAHADVLNLDFITQPEKRSRVEMIDMLWINKDNTIEYALEVENSTNFTSGVQRASNLGPEIKKIMIVPDNRRTEFTSITDPLFIDSFKDYKWLAMYYADVVRLQGLRLPTLQDLNSYMHTL